MAKRAGVSASTITSIIYGRKGKKNVPTVETINKIAASVDGINKQWLLTGEGVIFTSTHPDKDHTQGSEKLYKKIAKEVSLIEVPFIPVTVQASFVESFNQGDNFEHLAETRYFHVPNPEEFKKSLSFEVEGSSMEPTLYSADQVLVTPIDKGDWEYASGGVFALIFKDYFVIKRIINNDLMLSGVLTLHSDNPNGGKLIVKYEDIRAMWKVRLAFKTIK